MMKIKKLILSMLLVIFCAAGFAGCGKSNSGKVIAFVPQSVNAGEFWDDISNKLKQQLESDGFTYRVDGPEEWSPTKQAEVINKLVNEKVDAIVVTPTGYSELFEAFKNANKAGIKIILVDTDINEDYLASYGAQVTSYVGVDNYKGGEQIGKLVAEKLPQKAEVAIFSGGVENENSEDRCNGFSNAVKNQGMDVVVRNAIPDWTEEDAYAKAKIIFKAYPNIKAVFTANGNMNRGVFKAADELGINIISGSFDTDADIMKKIDEGKVISALDQDSEAMSKKVSEVVKKCIAGEKVDRVANSEGKIIKK